MLLRMIGILVLSSQLSVAVQTESGFAEATFPNTSEGAEELVEFAENVLLLADPEIKIHVIVARLDDEANMDAIVDKLASIELSHGWATPVAVRSAAEKNGFPEQSAKAVAFAFGRPRGH